MDVIKRGRYWLGIDRRGCWSSKQVDCDIVSQDLIGIIEYSYHQGVRPVYNPKELPGVTTARPRVAGVLQLRDKYLGYKALKKLIKRLLPMADVPPPPPPPPEPPLPTPITTEGEGVG
jgi:hypothetical protein